MCTAAYVRLDGRGQLQRRVEEGRAQLECCRLCPRACGVNRVAGETEFCGIGRWARVASAHPHFGEEAPLVGQHGSGTIFFSGCNLLCTFCQNWDISHQRAGAEISARELSELPLVYNAGGYESEETLRLLDGVVDVYMPDFKFWDAEGSGEFCRARDYREYAMNAIREMHRQVGDLRIDRDGVARRGLLVRHLVMPGGTAETAEIMRFLAREISPDTYVNVMAQYRPCGTAAGSAAIGRGITQGEYERAVAAARAAGLSASSVKKKMKEKAFAAAVSREDIARGAELLGLPLEEHIEHVIAAMQEVAPRLGLV